MKSRRTHLAWMVSLVVHVCLAVVVAYVAISSKQLKVQDTIDLSFFIVTPPQAAKRMSFPSQRLLSRPLFQICGWFHKQRRAPRRTTLAREVRSSATAAPAASLMGGTPAAPRGRQVKVPSATPVLQHTAQPLTTAAKLPTASDGLPAAGLPSDGGITDGISAGIGDGLGNGTGRGAFGSGSGVGQGRTQDRGRLNHSWKVRVLQISMRPCRT